MDLLEVAANVAGKELASKSSPYHWSSQNLIECPFPTDLVEPVWIILTYFIILNHIYEESVCRVYVFLVCFN
jgi:hypothetical protein